MKAEIRYLALVSKTPHRLAQFYRQALGLRELGRSPEGDVSLTDGFYNLTFLLQRPDRPEAGFRLAGVAVDDLSELEGRLAREGAELRPDEGGIHGGEFRLHDPNGVPVAVSTTNFGVPAGEAALPRLVHAAMCVPDGARIAQFYAQVFGFEKASPDHWGPSGRFLRDGTTNLAILASAEEIQAIGRRVNLDRMTSGWSHFGFEALSAEDVVALLPEDAGATQRTDRPKSQGYYRIWDPDGNHFDLRSLPAWQDGD
ncbi:MAG: VOC family protein [Chloroflexi bacterium]|nr:VOC family protein [Chloroflexota bacterium]